MKMDNSSTEAMERYKQTTRELLVRRVLSPPTMQEEGQEAERLDELWRSMTEQQHDALEAWFKNVYRSPLVFSA